MTGMVLRLLLKACIPLGLLVGSLSYGLYLKGGDPLRLLEQVAGGAVEGLAQSGEDVRAAASGAVGTLSGTTPSMATGSTIHTWVDSAGRRHFSNRDDVAEHAEEISLHPDRNLMQGLRARPTSGTDSATDPAGDGRSRLTIVRDAARVGEPATPAAAAAALPGIANFAVSEGADREALLDLMR